jgi:hypothetical protein
LELNIGLLSVVLEKEMAGNHALLFSKYTDEQLLELAIQRDTLLDPGKTALDEEMKRRGFDLREHMAPAPEVAAADGKSKPATRSFIWFAPSVGFYALILIAVASPSAAKSTPLLSAVAGYSLISPFGSFWMLYQVIRFESRPLKYVLLSFVPCAFLWYYFERVRKRTYVGRLPVALR